MSQLSIYLDEMMVSRDPEYYGYIAQMEREILEQQLLDELKNESEND